MKSFLLLFFSAAALVLSSCATVNPGSGEIPSSVNDFLLTNGTDFDNYRVSDVGAEYNIDEQAYSVSEDIETLWGYYMQADPVQAFDSRIIDFGVVFNPGNSRVYSAADSPVPGFREGQIYILDLEFLGMYNIPVAFKISRIDSEKKMMEFIYLKNNLSNGYQQIYLKPSQDSNGESVTLVDHRSYYKSGHDFRDKVLYPPFHELTVRGFHENIFELNNVNWEIP